jgi:hypothetical protein
MNRVVPILVLLIAGCGLSTLVDRRIERNSTEVYEIEKKQLGELAPAYDAERSAALRKLTADAPVTADAVAESKTIADQTAAGRAYRQQERLVEASEYRLADASQRMGPPYGRTAREMQLARETEEDERLMAALKSEPAK